MSDEEELDLGEAVDYILSERPRLREDAVWAVLSEPAAAGLVVPLPVTYFTVTLRPLAAESLTVKTALRTPASGSEGLALEVLADARPDVRAKDARRIIREWQAYARLERERDWEDDDAEGGSRAP